MSVMPIRSRSRRSFLATFVVAVLLAGLLGGQGGRARALPAPSPAPAPAAPAAPCTANVLVLSAMPLELNPLVRAAQVDIHNPVRIDGRTFYEGTLAGNNVVLAMTGIGPANATQTA